MRRAVWLLLWLAGSASAQVTVSVQLNADGDALAQQIGVSPAELAMRIQDRLNEAYGATDTGDFLRAFADATSFSMRGLGVDYVSMPTNLILGVGANVSIAASSAVDREERPTAGLAANVAFMAGMNLSDYGAPRWTVFANGFYRKASTSELHGGITSFGAHAQVRLIQPQEDAGTATKVLRWTGLDLTSGIELTRWSLGVDNELSTDFTIDGSTGSASVTIDSTGTYDVSATTATVPIEASTGLRIALLVSVYIGAGLDISVGKGSLHTSLDGTMTTSDGRTIGTTTVTGDDSHGSSPLVERIFTGAQLNLWKLKAYVQLDASPLPAASLGFGIRGVL